MIEYSTEMTKKIDQYIKSIEQIAKEERVVNFKDTVFEVEQLYSELPLKESIPYRKLSAAATTWNEHLNGKSLLELYGRGGDPFFIETKRIVCRAATNSKNIRQSLIDLLSNGKH